MPKYYSSYQPAREFSVEGNVIISTEFGKRVGPSRPHSEDNLVSIRGGRLSYTLEAVDFLRTVEGGRYLDRFNREGRKQNQAPVMGCN